MNKCIKVGSWGATALIVTLCITKILISAPSLYVKQSATAGWIELLISSIFEIFVLCIIFKLVFHFDKMDLIDISGLVFGKIGRIIVGLLSCTVFIINSAAVFRCFGELIRNTVIRGLPYERIAVFLLISSIIAASLGITTQINLNSLILPFIIFSIGIILFINYPRYTISNILPILGYGITDTVSNALLKNASFFEIGIILFLIPHLGETATVKKIGFTSLFISTFLSSLITLFYQLSVPYEAAKTFSLPLYQMTRMIKAGTFFQRIEPLNALIWGGTIFIYVSVGVWLTSHIFTKTFSLKNSKPLVFIFSFIICLLALIPGSETSVERIYDFLMTYNYIAYPLMPLLVLIVSVACSKKNRKV